METLEVGDLVRDNLNQGVGNYGLGVIVKVDVPAGIGEKWARSDPPRATRQTLRRLL